MRRENPEIEALTKAVYASPPYGIPPVVVHPDLNPDLKSRLREIFVSLDGDPEAVPLMEKLRIQRFEPGDDAAYDSVREMRKWVLSRSEVTE
jgi:phosphonate transport system substrate-binding protein